ILREPAPSGDQQEARGAIHQSIQKRCPWRPPKPCSSACCSWRSLKARVDRPPSQAATCTVSDSGSRELGGSKERTDWTKPGQAAPLRDPVRLRWQVLGKPSPRHHLPLPCLLAFNVTVRSDRQGTCQGSHVAQACVGHCESSAFPSRYSVLVASGYRHNITSVSQCCTISGLRKVKVQLRCGGSRKEELEVFTARACQCDMCRLSRY
uniref:Glycoprotein hormone subunit alpha 2 n=1 Tax=Ovis aries TaxID=9940 RepID=A0AC11E1N2_SHEEP